MKRALVVGIDKYTDASCPPLSGCENDATAVASILRKNGDGSPNFSVKLLSSDSETVTREKLDEAVKQLFGSDAETVLFFFAGHGFVDEKTKTGYIITQDGKRAAWGVSLAEIVSMANAAYPRIRSTVIILDSCQSGAAGEAPVLGNLDVSVIGNGVTILTACRRDGYASESSNGHGLFTGLLLEALEGTSADVLGRITPASVYSLIDQTLGEWEQRPLYKANVQTFVTLRHVAPRVAIETLRRLPEFFPNPGDVFKLDPSCEPDRGDQATALSHIPVVKEREREYRQMQSLNRQGLVVPVDQPHLWHAAVFSTGCKLTALGAHYRRLAQHNKF